MEDRRFILRKIPIEQLMEVIESLYAAGADFVDVIGIERPIGIQDEIILGVMPEYMSKERFDNKEEEYDDDNDDDDAQDLENIVPPPPAQVKKNILTLEEINKLIL